MNDDKIRIGDIRDSEGLAVGDHAQAASTEGHVAQVGGNVQGDVIVGSTITNVQFDAAASRDRRDKLLLLDKVKRAWITGVLERSVHVAAWIDLGKEEQADAVQHPWDMVLDTFTEGVRALPPDQKIVEIFDDRDRALFILGAPGSGKTITLLELARDTIRRAERDPSQPIPVVLNLSSWSARRSPLAVWVVDELNEKYQIPRTKGRTWLENSDILLLLDGLDEVRTEHQRACVRAINAFRAAHGLCGITVCGRSADYERLGLRLQLSGAIRLQPLAHAQIEQYLTFGGHDLDSLRSALALDSSLTELATSPLMLSVMTVAYRGRTTEDIVGHESRSSDDRLALIFAAYIDAMFNRTARTNKPLYSRSQTLHYLASVSRALVLSSQTVLLVEQIQPTYLRTHFQQFMYMIITRSITAFFLIPGFTLMVPLFAISALILHQGNIGFLVVMYVIPTALSGITSGLISYYWIVSDSRRPRMLILYRTLAVLIIISVLIVSTYVYEWQSLPSPFFGNVSLLYPVVILVLGWRCIPISKDHEIRVVENISWSIKKCLVGALSGLCLAIMYSTIMSTLSVLRYLIIIGLSSEGTPIRFWLVFPLAALRTVLPMFLSPSFWLISVLPLATLGFVLGGITGRSIDETMYPNQGIYRSARMAAIIGAIFGCLVTGALLLITSSQFRIDLLNLYFPVALGLLAASISALWFGGFTCIQHFTLRAVLRITGQAPWRYVHFLDFAVGLTLLQRVGGGYIFMHRLLLEHFAALPSTSDRSADSRNE